MSGLPRSRWQADLGSVEGWENLVGRRISRPLPDVIIPAFACKELPSTTSIMRTSINVQDRNRELDRRWANKRCLLLISGSQV
jgi:hypothetical protein